MDFMSYCCLAHNKNVKLERESRYVGLNRLDLHSGGRWESEERERLSTYALFIRIIMDFDSTLGLIS